MGKKSRQKARDAGDREAKKEAKKEARRAPPPPVTDSIASWFEGPMALVAGITVAMVALWFSLKVNRVFDVPKAVALKTGGCGVLLAWVLYGLFGKGYRWKSLKLFFVPVLCLVSVVGVSTLLSIDPWMSLVGVYERQFGFQGLLACMGLFVAAATGLRSRRGAVAGLALIAVLGGIISAHAYLQSQGLDPWGFFKKPHNKVYATLGNATFAGNSLALIFPVSLVLSVVGFATTVLGKRGRDDEDSEGGDTRIFGWLAGAILTGGLLLLPGTTLATSVSLDEKAKFFKMGCGLAVVLIAFAGLVGTWGHEMFRLESASGRRLADAYGAGALMTVSLLMLVGLYCTRTRGAWVGTSVALTGMCALLPILFSDDPPLQRRIRTGSYGLLASGVIGVALFVLVIKPDHLVSKTIKSIPYGFMPNKTVYGQGQGTRPYLWGESPRVLFNHGATLDRMANDRADYAKHVPKALQAPDARETDWLPAGLRKALVWPFGIGIETYRFAFMSHKSKKLEALDPMTNHDNPHNNYLYTLASCGLLGLAAYLWLLWRLLSVAWGRFRSEGSRAERAIAFGVVTSFFSYSVYSIAGFDSVACSVFLYFLLGCAAAFFEPVDATDPRRTIVTQMARQWRAFRGGSPDDVPEGGGLPVAIGVAGVAGVLLLHSVWAVHTIYDAEQQFVANRSRSLTGKIQNLQKAIKLNPKESFYRQSLGGTYLSAARRYRQEAVKARNAKKPEQSKAYLDKSRQLLGKAEQVLYSALNHAWAPENIFISLFQLHYSTRQYEKAERAIIRGLDHSPHLAPVRANLAVLQATAGRCEDALPNALWVLEISQTNMQGVRTAACCLLEGKKLDEAKPYFDRLKAMGANDMQSKRCLADFEAAKKAATSTTR